MKFLLVEGLRSGDSAQIEESNVVPPRDRVGLEYIFNQVNHCPPIDSDHLVHLTEHPWLAPDELRMFNWVPKKIRERLKCTSQDEWAEGWGIQYIERVDDARVNFWRSLSAVLSLIFGIVWAAVKQDLSAGFTGAGTILIILWSGIEYLRSVA